LVFPSVPAEITTETIYILNHYTKLTEMLTIPLPYINFRFHRRIIITILGIAVSVMFVIASFIVVTSLSTSTSVLLDKFKKGNSVIYAGDSLSESRFNVTALGLKEEYAAGILVDVKLNGTTPAYLVGMYNPRWASGSKWIRDCNVSDGEVRIGKLLYAPSRAGSVVLSSSAASAPKTVNGTFTSHLFPDSWVIGSIGTARELAPWLGNDEYSFVIVLNTTQSVISTAQQHSLNVNEMPSALSFYSEGTNQLERDLWLVVAIAAIIITILIYTTMSMELMERKRDIGIMRGIGAGSKTIFSVFFTQTLILALIGGMMGCFAGILASYGVTSMGVHMGYKTLFVVDISPVLIGFALLVAVIAGIIGGVYPVYRATRMKVTECME
jgi:putative ABC transport system permease protein